MGVTLQCTEMGFDNFWINSKGYRESIGRNTEESHLCAMQCGKILSGRSFLILMKVTRNSFSLGTIEVSRNSRGKMQVHQNMYPYTLNSIVYSMVKNISICPKRNFYPLCLSMKKQILLIVGGIAVLL